MQLKKTLPLFVMLLFCAKATHAQTEGTRYALDNFDLRDGVRIHSPAPAPETKPAIRPRRVKLTARAAEASLPSAENYGPKIGMTPGKSLGGYTTGDPKVDEIIVASSARHGVDPLLIYSIMHRESSFKKRALSHKGASGLMQLMPGTAARFGVRNIWDPQQNIEGGTRYVRFLLNFFDGDVRLALAGYNAGEGAVLKYGRRVPPYSETQEYVRRITQRYALIRDPEAARRAPVVTRTQVASLQQKEKPLSGNLYELNVYAVRMPDGKLRLISQ